MNLSDNRINLIKSGLALLLIPIFFACEDPTELGLQLEDTAPYLTLQDTTIVLPATTIYIDSLRTDHFDNFTLFGQYSDPTKGTVTATSNNSYNVSKVTLPEDTLEFESAYLSLKVSSLKANSIVSGEQITIYESQDTIFANGVYLSNKKLTKLPTPIADYTFSFDPIKDSVLTIPLSESFGQFLFSHLEKAGSDSDFKDSLLRKQIDYKSLIMEAGTANKILYSFNLSDDTTGIYIKMKSKTNANASYNSLFDFKSTPEFTGIVRQSGPLFDTQPQDYEETSAQTNEAHLDMLAGLYPRIDLQPLLQLIYANEDIIFNSVKLEIGAIPNTANYVNEVNLLRYYFLKDNGRIDGPSIATGNIFTSAVLNENAYAGSQNVSLLNTLYVSESESYSENITMFSQRLRDYYHNKNTHLTEQLVVIDAIPIGMGQSTFKKESIKAKIYYSQIKK